MKNPLSVPILPSELLEEILSWLPVKTLMQFACVSKSWKFLITNDRSFAKLHLSRSPKNTHILLTLEAEPYDIENDDTCVVPCSVRSLTEDPSSVIDDDEGYYLKENRSFFGSCNGLVCWGKFYDEGLIEKLWVQFWNPATHLTSKKSQAFCINMRASEDAPQVMVNSGFGYDNSSDTYKVVVVHWDYTEQKMETKIHCMGDISCRKILSNHSSPLMLRYHMGHFVSGCVNWLALKNMNGPNYQWENVTLQHLVIASLDMCKEEYRYLPLPEGVSEVPHFEPDIGVLGNHMCISHDYNRTHFVVWQMRDYGVRESWTRLISISYDDLQCRGFLFCALPMFLSEDSDILLLARAAEDLKFIKYNIRDNNVEYIENPNEEIWLDANCYVPSLVSPCQD